MIHMTNSLSKWENIEMLKPNRRLSKVKQILNFYLSLIILTFILNAIVSKTKNFSNEFKYQELYIFLFSESSHIAVYTGWAKSKLTFNRHGICVLFFKKLNLYLFVTIIFV